MANLYNKAGLVNIPSGYRDGFLHNIKPENNTLGFRFNRDSAATRVNKEGLIEQVGYFGPELVQNGDFSQLGPELVVNGGFDTDSDWVKGPRWSISEGKAICSANGKFSFIRQTGVLTSGKIYKITLDFDGSGITSGSIKLNGADFSNASSAERTIVDGTNIFYVEATSSDFAINESGAVGTGIFDNISVKEVGQNWSLTGSNVYISDGKLNFANAASNSEFAQQNIIAPTGKMYKVTLKVSNLNSGDSIKIRYPFQNININTNGTHTLYGVGDYANFFRITPNSSTGSFSIDNVSVVEVKGDKPRIDYTDSLTSPSLLLEPQSTNLITYSEDFSNSSWTKNNCTVISNTSISPDGTQNADKLNFTTSNGEIVRTTSFTSGQQYTMSFYAKTESGTLNFKYGNVSYENVSGTATTEWQKFEITQIPPTASRYPKIQTTEIGSLLLWGFQVEQLPYATSYIPTAGSTVTRTQETCIGAGNVSTFNSTEGVLYAEMAALADDNTYRYVTINDGTDQNVVAIRFSNTSNQILAFTRISGAFNAVLLTTSYSTVNFNKIAYRYKSGDFSLFVNGTKVGSSTSTQTLPANTLNTLSFDNAPFSQMHGKVKSIYAFNEALTDDELQQLTGPEYNSFAALAAAYNYTVI